ncbi:MAG: hypothetical protein BM565_13560 [Gammaproteobacteria bacterium MedPE]|nr:MAG: hypothetical protein BM565_13560 [Gammaproteobacteria bacterium MedPE]
MKYTLYHMGHCPYCKKVIKHINKLQLDVSYKDLDIHEKLRTELKNGGGKVQVPCLLIEKKGQSAIWMYESQEIINYLS